MPLLQAACPHEFKCKPHLNWSAGLHMAPLFDMFKAVTYTHSAGSNMLLLTDECQVVPGPRLQPEGTREAGTLALPRAGATEVRRVPSVSLKKP